MIVSVQVADNVGVRSDEFSFATCPMIGYGAVLGATPSHGAFLCVFSHFEKGGSSILYDYTFPFVDEMGHFKRLQNMLILIAYKDYKTRFLWYHFIQDSPDNYHWAAPSILGP